MILSLTEYRDKVMGCWMGKNIGGTLGAPFEWVRQINDVAFYTHEIDGNPLPNDDLDLQLVWLITLEEKGIELKASTLGQYWLTYITPHWMEYGNSKINMRSGLMPPLSGIVNNPYKDSCGAYIRSEIWACIAPGCPGLAAQYAYEDAIVDHGDGEGMYAEIFCAALESAAFVEKDTNKLIDIGLSHIPENCGVASAVKCVLQAYHSGKTWLEARDEILDKHRGHYMEYAGISDRDREKGFADGIVGYDAPSNIAIVILAWLYAEGDFGQMMIIAVNCGEDTDCTAATLGSIYGIIHGIAGIPQNWIDPIGRNIKTLCLNNGELQGGAIPPTIDNLTDRVERIAKQVVLRFCPDIELSETKPTDLSDVTDASLFADIRSGLIYRNLAGPIYKFDSFEVGVEYSNGPYAKNNEETKLKLHICNTYKIQESVNIHWYLPDSWAIAPAGSGKLFFDRGQARTIEFTLRTEKPISETIRFVVELTFDGKHEVNLIPILLQNANLETHREDVSRR